MDKRWKAVERKVADRLTEELQPISGAGKLYEFQRIPLLGRDGPDLTVNDTGLVINVKSRMCIPVKLFPGRAALLQIGSLVCFRLEAIGVAGRYVGTNDIKPWKQLQDWYDWMDVWTQRQPNKDRLISCIIIHRPRMPIGHAGVVIHSKHLKRLQWTSI